MENPFITTIIPTFKRPHLLKRAIKSVLSQTYTNFIIQVYDNASHDETSNVVKGFMDIDSRVRYHCHEDNIGAINNFNFGIQNVKTPFFNCLADDDVLLPEFFKIATETLEKFPEAMFFSGSPITIRDTGEIFHVALERWDREGLYASHDRVLPLCGGDHPNWTAILFRSDILSSNGALDLKTKRATDLDFELRAAAKYPYYISKIPCALFTSHPDSSCVTENAHEAWDGWAAMVENVDNSPYIPTEIKKQARLLLYKTMSGRLVILGLKEIMLNKLLDAQNTLKTLVGNQDIKNNFGIFMLKTLLWIVQNFPPFQMALSYLYQSYRKLKRKKNKYTFNQYNRLRSYL